MKKTLLIILCFGLVMAALFGLATLKERLEPEEAATPTAVVENVGWVNDLDEVHAVSVVLAGTDITVNGLGAAVEGNTVTIRYPGTYILSGSLTDGQVVVDCDSDGTVYLVLDNASVCCSYGPAIMVLQAQDTVIVLPEGTENYVADGANYTIQLLDAQGQVEEDQPDAAIYSRDDLHFEGAGRLTVVGYYQEAIRGKDDLVFAGGDLTLYAVNDGAKGTDSLSVEGGTLLVYAQGDGLQANKGSLAVLGGAVTVQSGGDGLAAATELSVEAGSVAVTAAGGWECYSDIVMSDVSAKGLKADSIVLRGGEVNLNTADDGVHAESSLVIDGGLVNLWSGDDALSAGQSLAMRGGEVAVEQSYEGLEALSINISDGGLRVWAENNGLTATLDLLDTEHTADDCGIHIAGGIVDVVAGQAVKTDGVFLLEEGAAFLQGVNADDEALDAALGGRMQGGTLVVCGSISAAPVSLETDHSALLHRLTTAAEAGTAMEVLNEDGALCFSYTPRAAYGTLYIAYNGLIDGQSYQLSVGEETSSLVLGETAANVGASGEMGGPSGGMGGGMRPF